MNNPTGNAEQCLEIYCECRVSLGRVCPRVCHCGVHQESLLTQRLQFLPIVATLSSDPWV